MLRGVVGWEDMALKSNQVGTHISETLLWGQVEMSLCWERGPSAECRGKASFTNFHPTPSQIFLPKEQTEVNHRKPTDRSGGRWMSHVKC